MSVHGVVGVHEIPGSVATLSSLPRLDYADRFTLSTDADATPEQWARAIFGDVPGVAGGPSGAVSWVSGSAEGARRPPWRDGGSADAARTGSGWRPPPGP